jgi:hypothetical protein
MRLIGCVALYVKLLISLQIILGSADRESRAALESLSFPALLTLLFTV